MVFFHYINIPWVDKDVLIKLGAQTMARFLLLIPVSFDLWATFCKWIIRCFKVLKWFVPILSRTSLKHGIASLVSEFNVAMVAPFFLAWFYFLNVNFFGTSKLLKKIFKSWQKKLIAQICLNFSKSKKKFGCLRISKKANEII